MVKHNVLIGNLDKLIRFVFIHFFCIALLEQLYDLEFLPWEPTDSRLKITAL